LNYEVVAKAFGGIIIIMLIGWMSWVSTVAIEAGNKSSWMRKQQEKIDELQKIVFSKHPDAVNH